VGTMLLTFCFSLLLCAGCGVGPGGIVPIPVVLPVPITTLGANVVPLDGQWVLTDDVGRSSCLTIQESRVSILNITCSNDPSGFVARVIESPIAARAGNRLTFTVRYNPNTGENREASLTFTGLLQGDATFIGTRTDLDLDGAVGIRTNATFTRAP
jgi:hypothetical protein